MSLRFDEEGGGKVLVVQVSGKLCPATNAKIALVGRSLGLRCVIFLWYMLDPT
jgi:hypothetical protein